MVLLLMSNTCKLSFIYLFIISNIYLSTYLFIILPSRFFWGNVGWVSDWFCLRLCNWIRLGAAFFVAVGFTVLKSMSMFKAPKSLHVLPTFGVDLAESSVLSWLVEDKLDNVDKGLPCCTWSCLNRANTFCFNNSTVNPQFIFKRLIFYSQLYFITLIVFF